MQMHALSQMDCNQSNVDLGDYDPTEEEVATESELSDEAIKIGDQVENCPFNL